MATQEKTTDQLNLTSVALELFKARSTNSGANPQQLAFGCFRDATIFLDAANEVMTGSVDLFTADANPLDLAYAPNLKRTHPINLMSRAWGDLRKVQTALAELEANPAADSYEPYSWGKPEVNQARALFPSVVIRAKQLLTAK